MDYFLSSPQLIVIASISLIVAFLTGWLFQKQFSNRGRQNALDSISKLEKELAVMDERQLQTRNTLEKTQQDFSNSQQQLEQKQQQINTLMTESASLKVQLEDEKNLSREKLALLQDSKEQMQKEFKIMASDIMKNNSESFSKQQQQDLSKLLNPFKEQLGEFRKRVDHVYDTETRDRTSLINEIQSLKKLNQQITEEASNLTQALKGDRKAQGNWGEMILERVLEVSGLKKGREYVTQKSLQSHEGNRYQPDVIIHLPENKDIIVDAKVSLSAYERYSSTDDDNKKEQFIQEHLIAIKNHVEKLSSKKYDDLKDINTLDFVIIFIPIEPAYLLAAEKDPNLMTNALAKKIIIVSPTTLLATLRIVENVWRFERQNKNAEEIARQAGRLFDKFVGFADDLETIGNRIDQAYQSYESAKNKLSTGKGNLVRSSEKLKKLGAKTRKQISEKLIESQEKDDT